MKHETLFHNADVLAAGEIHIRSGVIAGLNDHSGSYGTAGALEENPEFSTSVLSAVERLSLPIDEATRQYLQQLSQS